MPRGQARHAVELMAPVIGWCVPSPHATQPELLSRPVTLDQRPGSHGVHAEGESAPGSSQ